MRLTLNRYTIRFLLLCLFTLLLRQPRIAHTESVDGSPAQRATTLAVADNVRMLGQWGGVTNAVYVVANRTYIGEGPRLIILDVTNPSQPTLLGKTLPLPGVIEDIVVSGTTAYVAIGESGFSIVDVTSPAGTHEISSFDTPGYAKGVVVVDSTLYVADGWAGGLRIVNVANPASPSELGFYDTPGVASSVSVVGSIAYIADGASGLRIVNVENPTSPSEIGFYDTPDWSNDVFVVGSIAYIADGVSGLRIINIADSASPNEVGFYDTPGYASGVTLVDSTAYVADGRSGLRIINVANPASPNEIGFYDTLKSAENVAMVSATAYIASRVSGLHIVDTANLASPSEAGSYYTSGSVGGVVVDGSIAYLANWESGLRIMNIANPASPSEIGLYDTPDSVTDVFLEGSTAYVADFPSGLRIVNVANPASPKEVGSYDTPGVAWNVFVVGSVAYVADLDGGLRIIDVTNPTSPSEVGFYTIPGYYARSVVVSSSIAYVAFGWNGLHILDVTNPANPYQVGSYDTPGYAEDIAMVGSTLYIADGIEGGLRIVDVTSPTSPTEVGFYDTPGAATQVFMVGSNAYITDASSGLRIMDVSNPTIPREVSYYNTSGRAWGLSVVGSTVYVADIEGGLAILQYPACYRLVLEHTGTGNNPTANPTKSPGCNGGEYLPQTAISLTASPGIGFKVSNWIGTTNDSSTNSINSIVMPVNDVTVTVNYLEIPTVTPTFTPTFTPTPTPTPTYTPSGIGDIYENDDTCITARAIATDGTIQSHNFHKQADTDWAGFEAEAGKEYLIKVSIPADSLADVSMELYPACGNLSLDGQDYAFSPDVRLQWKAASNGPIHLKLGNNDSEVFGEKISYNLSVWQLDSSAKPGALIVVAGAIRNNDPVQPNIYHVTDAVYQLFIDKGYTDDRIYYLAPDLSHSTKVDRTSTKANLEAAIKQWAKNYVASDRALTLYLMDHGAKDLFYLDKQRSEWVTPNDLNSWLNNLETAIPGLAVNVIIEACYSGSFITTPSSLSKPGRVVVTSTDDTNLAWASQQGALFSDYLLPALARGDSLYSSYRQAQIAAGIANPSQAAWIDGDGDGDPHDAAEQSVAVQRGFNYPGSFPPDLWPPYIAKAEPPPTIEDGRGLLRAYVRDDENRVNHVWAVIYPPSYKSPTAGESLVQEALPTATLLVEGNDWYHTYFDGFRESGTYRIVIYADDDQGLDARPVEMPVIVNTGSNIFLPIVTR